MNVASCSGGCPHTVSNPPKHRSLTVGFLHSVQGLVSTCQKQQLASYIEDKDIKKAVKHVLSKHRDDISTQHGDTRHMLPKAPTTLRIKIALLSLGRRQLTL